MKAILVTSCLLLGCSGQGSEFTVDIQPNPIIYNDTLGVSGFTLTPTTVSDPLIKRSRMYLPLWRHTQDRAATTFTVNEVDHPTQLANGTFCSSETVTCGVRQLGTGAPQIYAAAIRRAYSASATSCSPSSTTILTATVPPATSHPRPGDDITDLSVVGVEQKFMVTRIEQDTSSPYNWRCFILLPGGVSTEIASWLGSSFVEMKPSSPLSKHVTYGFGGGMAPASPLVHATLGSGNIGDYDFPTDTVELAIIKGVTYRYRSDSADRVLSTTSGSFTSSAFGIGESDGFSEGEDVGEPFTQWSFGGPGQ